MKMSRATHSLLKAIKIGITVFFKTQKNGKKRLIKKKKKTSRATHIWEKHVIGTEKIKRC